MKIEDAKTICDLPKIQRNMSHNSAYNKQSTLVWELAPDKKSLTKLVRALYVTKENWVNFTSVRPSVASYAYYNLHTQELKLSHLAPINESEVAPSKTLDNVVEVKRKDKGVKDVSK